MEKINKIIFIKHMNLKLQYISIKLLPGDTVVHICAASLRINYMKIENFIFNRLPKRVNRSNVFS